MCYVFAVSSGPQPRESTPAMSLPRFILLCVFLFPAKGVLGSEPDLDSASLDPSKVVGSEACMKCHGMEYNVWKNTPHFETFRTLHKNPDAQAISSKLGLRSIKRGELCVQCHYTEKQIGEKTKVISGVSCESCHGAARDWIAIHNDYGGPTVTKSEESIEHRLQRLEDSIRNGMRNPANPYLIARSCLNCHSVPHERLVNEGGHQAGSLDFELVSWSQGIIRHNFQRGEGSNVPSSKTRIRVMYVVGLMTDLEFSLRATAKATNVAEYGVTSAQRAFKVRALLAEIQEEIQNEYLQTALERAYATRLKTNNAADLVAAADEVGKAAFRFAETVDGGQLAAIDKRIPSESDYKQ